MPNTVLVAGAGGLVGTAVVDRFLDDGWDVIAVSRREPEVLSDRPFRHLAVDLQDAAACTRELLGESHHYADFCFLHGATEDPPLAFVSTVKIEQHGFCEVMDTEESFRHWIRVLQQREVLPPSGSS